MVIVQPRSEAATRKREGGRNRAGGGEKSSGCRIAGSGAQLRGRLSRVRNRRNQSRVRQNSVLVAGWETLAPASGRHRSSPGRMRADARIRGYSPVRSTSHDLATSGRLRLQGIGRARTIIARRLGADQVPRCAPGRMPIGKNGRCGQNRGRRVSKTTR